MRIPHAVHSIGSKALLVVAAGALAACSNGGDTITTPSNRVASVEVLPPPTSLLIGESFTLTAVARNSEGTQPSSAPLTWRSSNSSVASVVQGIVTARAEGVADISAEAEGKSGSARVVVTSTQRLFKPDTYTEGTIGFTSTRSFALDAYIIGPAGIQRVTTSADYEQFDGWSPDGARVAVIRSPVDRNEVTSHILNSDGTGDLLVSPGIVNWAPDWLHRGSILDGKIVVSNFDGTGEHQVGATGVDLFGPWWSPDGQRVAFGHKPSETELADIYVANVDGSGLLNVTQSANLSEEFASWSPDGTRLAITGENQGSGVGSGLFIVNANGTNRVQLTTSIAPRGDYEPEWSPDGKRIAYTTYFVNTFGIFVIDPAGGQPVRLTPLSLFAGFGHWSPDGTRIAFTAYPEGFSRQAVFVLTLDRKSITQITPNSSDNLGPYWRPR